MTNPISLDDLLGTMQTVTATLRGRPVTVRGLSTGESLAIERQCPEPPAADGGDPAASAEARRLYQTRRRALIVGAACGIAHANGDGWSAEKTPGWAQGYADHIIGRLTEIELLSLYNAQLGASSGNAQMADERDRIGTDDHQGN